MNFHAIIEPPQLRGDVASMAWNLHAIEQTQSRERRRVDGVGRLKFDSHTAPCDDPGVAPAHLSEFGMRLWFISFQAR